jgi:hypothetical protein
MVWAQHRAASELGTARSDLGSVSLDRLHDGPTALTTRLNVDQVVLGP